MTTRPDPPTWAILAPLTPRRLRTVALHALRQGRRVAEDHRPDWDVVAGRSGSALLSYETGSEGTEQVLAEALSRSIAGPVVALRLSGAGLHQEYEAGVLAAEPGRLPRDVLADHGVHLPSLEPPPSADRSVCVVPGHAPAEVALWLGFDEPPTGPLHVEPAGDGSLVHSDAGGAGIFQVELSLSSDRAVYLLSAPASGGFSVLESRAGEHVGVYEVPRSTADDAPVLDAVAGEREPARIADALGVPRALLGLD